MQEISNNVTVDYQVGKLELKNSELLRNAVSEVADKYKDLIITDDTVQDDKKTKTELNGLLKQLEDKRKDYKKQYQIPLKEFEKSIKEIEEPLNIAIDNLKIQLNEYDKRTAEQKEKQIKAFIEEACSEHKADAKDIMINPKWLNKSTSKKTWQEEAIQAIKLQDAEITRFEIDKENVKAFAEQLNVNPDSYVYQLNMGASSIEVVQRMQKDVERAKKRQEALDAEIKAMNEAKKARTKVIDNKRIDTETGEVEKLESFTLTVTGKHEDLINLAKYMQEHNIDFQSAE
ncbi:hypothetical protein AKUH4B410M_09370 [Apilactobacillus kunkeei]|nr:hypothetical protein AKUH4B405J_09370 [Apilactobacillus kunkeei]CAI2618623.1 hypothetical protein AKUH4B410M_09370 [Apilactobacillus kunkeei]CAI2619021.1 hypothetical protein AKUH4B102A_09640 [Apilactobacillus kunkeei]CAI2683851.1 hypothetical protein AKUH3B102X_09360 [Apilactobacillus kunkeei]